MRTIPARELQPGDRVVRMFDTKTVQKVEVSEVDLLDPDSIIKWNGPPGVYIWWTVPGSKTKLRLDATVEVESDA